MHFHCFSVLGELLSLATLKVTQSLLGFPYQIRGSSVLFFPCYCPALGTCVACFSNIVIQFLTLAIFTNFMNATQLFHAIWCFYLTNKTCISSFPGGGVLSPKPNLKNLTFSTPIFCQITKRQWMPKSLSKSSQTISMDIQSILYP